MDSNYQQQAEHEQQQWLVYYKLQQARVKLQSMPLKSLDITNLQNLNTLSLQTFCHL